MNDIERNRTVLTEELSKGMRLKSFADSILTKLGVMRPKLDEAPSFECVDEDRDLRFPGWAVVRMSNGKYLSTPVGSMHPDRRK